MRANAIKCNGMVDLENENLWLHRADERDVEYTAADEGYKFSNEPICVTDNPE